ncbi:MAG: hypothetical protein JWQ58_1396 [Reyranella sp.]|nr:hypothetical protein [Reyranella sp.]
MGWHDALAAKSAEMGKTSAEFRAGAWRKAKATGLFLIVAGTVGYFAGWMWALLPGAVAAWSAFQLVSATLIAARLEALENQPRPDRS